MKKQSDFWKNEATAQDAVQHGLTADEYRHLLEVIGRPLSILEIGICSALFSEHCSYKSTKTHLRTLPTTGPKVVIGPGENAGVVDIGDGDCVVFKVESHNHPTFIEPYQGAATGVGGILRDIFTMGARPIAVMNALRFGEPKNAKTKHLLPRAVLGIGGYGNCMGIPTVGGELAFHESYNGNCLVNAFALGLVKKDQIFLGQAKGVGNPIFYVGSKTGRDGIHGATMSSAEFDEDAEAKRPTVQVGDPFQEKLLLEACLEVMKTGAVVGIQDMGAAGLTSSGYEMAERAGTGIRLDLDKVPMRESGMNPYELMLSESQERMLVIVEKGREQEVIKIIEKWELDAVEIGQVTEGGAKGGEVELYWHNECISKLNAQTLTSAVPEYKWPEEKPADYEQKALFNAKNIGETADLEKAWLKILGSENICSRHRVYSQYDSTVRTNTVIHPGGDAAVVRVKRPGAYESGAAEKGIAMTLDCNHRYCSIDPKQGAALSVAEAVRNITAVGAEPIGISDNLNFGAPHKPTGMWQIAEGIRGLGEAARAFNVPIISGNVSLNNETNGKAISPTPLVAMVGLMKDSSHAATVYFKKEGDLVFCIGETSDEDLGGSEYLATIHGVEKGILPKLNYEKEKKTSALIVELINQGLIASCHDVGTGGLAVAFAESCMSMYGKVGASIVPVGYNGRKDGLLFAETGARYLVSCKSGNEKKFRAECEKHGVVISAEGKVGGSRIEVVGYASLDLDAAYAAWHGGLDELFA